jgi:hypothetical protein
VAAGRVPARRATTDVAGAGADGSPHRRPAGVGSDYRVSRELLSDPRVHSAYLGGSYGSDVGPDARYRAAE